MARQSNERTFVLPGRVTRRPKAAASSRLGERVALFACAWNKDGAEDLLEGLGGPLGDSARSHAVEVLALDSASRQARLTREFGFREGAEKAVRVLLAQCSPELRCDLLPSLPPHLRAGLSAVTVHPARPNTPAAAVSLSRRLLLEAIR